MKKVSFPFSEGAYIFFHDCSPPTVYVVYEWTLSYYGDVKQT